MAGQNMIPPSDSTGGTPSMSQFEGLGLEKSLLKGLQQAYKEIDKIVKRIEGGEKSSAKIGKNLAGDTKTKDLGLGMGEVEYGYKSMWSSMSRGQKIGLGAMAVGSTAMAMAPNTMAAVTQRVAADTFAGVSGYKNPYQTIADANKAVGGGATSAMGPTMAAMALAYQGGYTFNSLSSKNIMGQLAGVSAITGMPNERAAAAVASANGMNFLRAGIRLRNPDGSQKAPSEMINDTYNFLYRGRKISTQEAMLAFRPGSRSYYTISQLAGGDQNLMQVLQAGVLARANAGGGEISGKTLKDAQKSLDLLGVAKDSPIRKMFQFNTSEAKVLQSTEKGLVGGYNAALTGATGLNNSFAALADAAGGATTALMGLKGFLQTFPGAGNVAGTTAGLASAATSYGIQALMIRSALSRAGITGATAAAGTSTATMAGTSALSKALSKGGKFLKGTGGLSLGGLLSGFFGYKDRKANAGKFNWGSVGRSFGTAFVAGELLGGAQSFGLSGLVSGTVAAGGNILGQLFAGGGQGGESGDTPDAPTSKLSVKPGSLVSPVPSGARITSHFGPRKVTYNSKGMPSSSFHHGTDYGIVENTPLRAVDDGRVIKNGFDAKGYGNYLVIQHPNNRQSLYGHLNKFVATVGKQVKAGDLVALSGGRDGAPGAGNSNGPHLHFEYGTSVTPGKGQVNSEGFFKGGGWLSSLFNNIKSLLGMGPSPRGQKYGTDANINMSKSSLYSGAGSLSSPGLASLLANYTHGSDPINYNDIAKHLSKKQLEDLQDQTLSYSNLGGGKGKVTHKELMQLLYRKGFKGRSLDTAFAVSLAESGGRPGALGDLHLQTAKWGPSVGLFQIRSLKHWEDYNDKYRDAKRLPNADFNSEAALVKSKLGKNWKPWTTFTSGAFGKFLADAAVTKQALKIPSYDVGVDRVPEDQLAFVHKNEMVVPAKTADLIRNGGSASLGGSTINVKMDVNIAQASPAEAERMVNVFMTELDKKLKLKAVGEM